jgi:hypothetical protein
LGPSSTLKKYIHKGYTHFYSDNELTDRLVAEKKYRYVPGAMVEHLHFLNGKAEVDETYKTIFNSETNAKDKALYMARKQNGYE